jgi:hypothetical protein
MKYLIGTVLLFTTVLASAFEIKVHKMTALSGMDRSFQLYTTTIPDQMVLDCQSFIQGLTIGRGQEDEVFYFLDPQECEALYGRTYQSLKKKQKHCLDVGDEIHSDYTCP